MKSLAKLGLVALAVVGTLAAVAPKVHAAVWFAPYQSRYPRGQNIILVANTFGPCQWVLLKERSTRGTRDLGWVLSGWDCIARMSYQVPTDPNKDDVHIIATYCGSGDQRIPIGR